MPISLTRQLQIIHLSDLHFGPDHRFSPPRTAMGDALKDQGVPTLLDKLLEDLQEPPVADLLICLTGDFTTTAKYDEFKQAEEFVRNLAAAKVHGAPRGLKNTFLVAGNHDVVYGSDNVGERFVNYTGMVSNLYKQYYPSAEPLELVQLHDRTADVGALILCLNSAIHVQRAPLASSEAKSATIN